MRFFSPGANDVQAGRSRPVEKRRANRTRRVLALECLETRALLSGTFTALTHGSPDNSNTMMLETDGSVIMQGGGTAKTWYHLTPDSTGSYVNGTWTQLASMGLQRLYYASNVLPDGRIFVQGGEYSGPYGVSNDTNTGEIYSPTTNSWSKIATFPQGSFGDDPSELLPNGNVLTGYIGGGLTYIYNPTSNSWSPGGTKLRNDSSDEEAWIKLPDGSILSYDVSASINNGNSTAQRYFPSSNTWMNTGAVPVTLSSSADGYELGPGFLLPDGRAFYLGANGNTAYYTPSTNSWTAGPVIPNGLGADDAPGAELPDGKILFTADTPLFHGPTRIFEFDPTSGTIGTYTDLTSQLPSSFLNSPSYFERMLVLPTGQVLFNNGSSQLYVYTPDLPPVASSTPTISGIAENADGSFKLSGTGLNGISEGAAYGDDAEMSSNYPIVDLTDPNGKVFYARTYNWSSTGVATGSTPESTSFSLPIGLPANTYSVRVIANGSPSAPFTLTTPTSTADPAPTIAVAASATPNPDPTTTASLSVLGADTLGESTLTYSWATSALPSGAAYPSFSANGTNAAKNDTVTFSHAGSYTFLVTATNLADLSATSSVTMNVTQTFTSATVSPTPTNVNPNATRQFSATGLDQFGLSLASQPSFTWTLASGNGSVTAAGLYKAPSSGTLATLTATSGGIGATASVYVLSAPLITQDIGGPAIAGAAGDNSLGTYTLLDAGSDIYGTSDEFRFAYTTLAGDGTLIARVVSEQNTNTYAKAGVMFRNDLSAGSLEAFMAITPGAGATFESRVAANGSTNAPTGGGSAAPYWVKLVRSGNLFSGYYSPDGVTWTFESSATVAMGSTVYVGLALTSHNAGTLNTTTFDHVNLGGTPTVVTPASASPNPDSGTTASLSVLGNDLAGESNLTYTWAATAIPSGAATPTFSANGTNAAKNDTVTLYQAGSYTFTVTMTDPAGLSTASSVILTVNQAVKSITLTPSTVTLPQGGTRQFSATAFDQFGQSLATQPTFTYAVTAGGAGGTISPAGLYSAPTSTFGTDQVTVSSESVSSTATITVTRVQANVGAVSVSWGSAGTASLQTDADGLRLLPAGRNTDLPWLNIGQITIILDKAGSLSPSDVSVTGLTIADYGPVTITGSGTTYTITLARPINAADRVTVTIGNADIATFTRRLDVLPGDFNDDGAVTLSDAIGIRNVYLGFVAAVPTLFGDINGDGVVDVNDYTSVRRLIGTYLQ